ncbi:MAG TPA: ATP-binding protein [Abditibacteriaceae bacterium]|jgi:PAS domain S-box-containing protein
MSAIELTNASTPDSLSPQMETEIQRRVAEQSRILNVALGSIEDFAYVFDRAGRFTYCNPPLLKLLDITLAEIIGKNFFDLDYPAELARRLQHQIEEVFRTSAVVRDETPYTNAKGKTGFYEYIFTPVFAADGTVEFVAGSTRDITERRQAEEESEKLLQQLGAERAKLHYLFTHAPAFVATLHGPQHIFELTNAAYSQLIGHRNVVGQPVRTALPEIEGQGFFELLDQVYATGESYTGREIPVMIQREPQGPLEQCFIDLVYQPIFCADGTVEGIFAHGVDITEQVQARKEAENANRAKDEFLATLSHELRTPLAAIMGWTHLLQSGEISAEESAIGLSTISRNARAQSQLIEDILDVSRMIAGNMSLEVQPVHLLGIMEEALSTILPAAQSKNIQFHRMFDEGVALVSGDPVRLQQIVGNLLSNALKFTPEGGEVGVHLHRTGSYAQIVVSDSGIGMAPEMLPRVFDRFRQADASSTRAQGGLGLGLAIVHHLVKLHGGTVTAQSEGLGKGATFTVQLPLIAPSVPAEPMCTEPTNPKNTRSLEGLRLLVVDDQADARGYLSVVLEKWGARVRAVSSAAEAFVALQEEQPDLLLSDIGMPEEDGISLIKKVRALPDKKGNQTPAIALTAFVRPEDRDKVLRSGFQAHLAKPIDLRELEALIHSLARP